MTVQTSLSTEEVHRLVELLRPVHRRLVAEISGYLGKPVRLNWDPSISTASTDCRAEVNLCPDPFLAEDPDLRRVGNGSAYHESGHIKHSTYGCEILGKAHNEGGQAQQQILNIIVDRKDDGLTMNSPHPLGAPGFRDDMLFRLQYICTMGMREGPLRERLIALAQMNRGGDPLEEKLHIPQGRDRVLHLTRRKEPDPNYQPSEKELVNLLRHSGNDMWLDFFMAAKWGRSAKHPVVKGIMRWITHDKLRAMASRDPEELVKVSAKILEELRRHNPQVRSEQEEEWLKAALQQINQIKQQLRKGEPLPGNLVRALVSMIRQETGKQRQDQSKMMIKALRSEAPVNPGVIAVHRERVVKPPVHDIAPNACYEAENRKYRELVQEHVAPLLAKIRQLDSPSEFQLYGQDDGDELDIGSVGRIAMGLEPEFVETVIERDLDLEIALAIDTSYSINESKLKIIKQIVTVFSLAIEAKPEALSGSVWSYNSCHIERYGKISARSGYVTATSIGSNSDTWMMSVVGKELLNSSRRRKVMIVLTDDGPDDFEEAPKMARTLMSRGIVPIHLMVGVHGSPQIYPIQLIFESIEDCWEQFGDLFYQIVSNAK